MLILRTVSRIFIKWRRVFTVFIFFQYSVIYNQYRLRKMMIQKKKTILFIYNRQIVEERYSASFNLVY